MKPPKMKRFLPNECYICKSRDNLKKCECNMIYYCSEDHRLEHLPVHETFCKVIKELLKEKKVSHIYEELTNITGSPWLKERDKIYGEILKKLERNMSPLENLMFYHPRNCFDCSNTKDKDLLNCPHCPVVSFCKIHPNFENHNINCEVLNRYLNILNTAEELNIDLKFLSPTFPCIREENVNQYVDLLTLTFYVADMKEVFLKSRLMKMDLINFMDLASKINNALQKIHKTIPKELLIHIDVLSYEHAIAEENYWEFLLHLNPLIKKLKIVITQTKNRDNLETPLCQDCDSEGKKLIVKYLSKSYDDYMQDENYQEPDILFYVQINDECNSERLNQWSKFNFPIILRLDSKLNFCKVHNFLSHVTAKFLFIYEGKIIAPFGILSSIENEDYFIILQSVEICEDKIATSTIEILSEIKNTGHQCGKNNSANGIENASKITPSESSESKDNSDNNENSKLETNENQSATVSLPKENKNIIENENTNKDEIESAKNSNCEQTENRESNNEEKSEDRVTLSPSSSIRSFFIISGHGEEEEEKNTETEENGKFLKSVDNEFFDPSGKGRKNTKVGDMEKKNIEERKEEENDKKILVNLESFDNNETVVNSSQSYVIGHVSYLENEIEGLRQQLNLAFNEITKLQTKVNQLSFNLNKKEKVIKKLLRVIVDSEDTDSQCDEEEEI
ncbi:uncharacterized protein LOC122508670 [Leptopilina heterotoma]|uniref:uncharacterized protein LOC122508670 n=1 Tax=Leptopilina heterotoma TaxID=63436 RepID=UPI001CA84717|nr:uncharacterized protein LOC122508670 [Leptopilina heterotoma]